MEGRCLLDIVWKWLLRGWLSFCLLFLNHLLHPRKSRSPYHRVDFSLGLFFCLFSSCFSPNPACWKLPGGRLLTGAIGSTSGRISVGRPHCVIPFHGGCDWTEVSLSPVPVVAAAGSNPGFAALVLIALPFGVFADRLPGLEL